MDWDKIEQLFNIGSAAQEHGPKYASIAAAAQLELEEHLKTATKTLEEKRTADEEEAGRQRAEAANKAQTEAEVQKAEEEERKAAQAAAKVEPIKPTPYPPSRTEDSDFRRI